MFSANSDEGEILNLQASLSSIKKKQEILDAPPTRASRRKAMDVRKAMLSQSEMLPVEDCLGRISSNATVGCPPAVPIVIPGEIIDEDAIECFKYYGIESCIVVK